MTLALDSYALRAQVFPAIVATAPAVALAYTLVPWDNFHPTQLVASLGAGVLLYACADMAADWGRQVQHKVFNYTGGMPSTRLMRYRDKAFSADQKRRWHQLLSKKIGLDAPTEQFEIEQPIKADEFYATAGSWLRQHTREKTNYRVLFEKNVSYGYRRNMLGLKRFGLLLNVMALLACGALIAFGKYFGFGYDYKTFYFVFVVAAAHAVYFLLVVNVRFAARSAEDYGHQLVQTTESFTT